MGKKKKKKKTKHYLLEKPDTLSMGERLSVKDVLEKHLIPNLQAQQRRPTTIRALCRAVDRFEEWWSKQTDELLPVAVISRRHLQLFREWLAADGSSAKTQNDAVRGVMQVCRAAVRYEFVTCAPTLEPLPHNNVAAKVFPADDELSALWDACKLMTWPTRDSSGKQLPYKPETAWKVAIIMYRTYGFRTQELVRLERGFDAITWSNIYPAGETPNPQGRVRSEFGWLVYTPQKQKRVKYEPLYLPLSAHAAAALDRVKPEDESDLQTQSVLDWPLSSVGFYLHWHRLFELSGLKPKAASGEERYKPKHLRKMATTEINRHMPQMAQHIIGHGGDRSGQQSVISDRHYDNAEHAIYKCVSTMPMPACFDEFLSCPVNSKSA